MPSRESVDSETLGALLEFYSCPALIVGMDRRIQAANSALRALVAPELGVIGVRCFEILHGRRRPCARRRLLCPLETCARTGSAVPAIHSHTPGMGDQILLTPIQGEDGTVKACLATLPASVAARMGPEPTGHDEIALAPVAEQLARLGRSRLPLLVHGEPGSGRSRVARAIHRLRTSPGPFQERTGPDLSEDELQALWTVARRDPGLGTLHLRDVHALRPGVQRSLGKLLAAEMGRRRRWRMISSTDRDLRALATSGLYQRDLVGLLASRRLRVPPLRERQAELPEIVRTLLRDIGGQVSDVTPAALERLGSHPFPGNLDELEQILRHASFLCPGGRADVVHLPDWLTRPGAGESAGPRPRAPVAPDRPRPPAWTGPAPRGERRRGSRGH
jgi:two-component system response regulator HydG